MKYPEYVYEAVCNCLELNKEEVNELHSDEVFEAMIAWKLGYGAWAETIKTWIKDIHNIDLPSQ